MARPQLAQSLEVHSAKRRGGHLLLRPIRIRLALHHRQHTRNNGLESLRTPSSGSPGSMYCAIQELNVYQCFAPGRARANSDAEEFRFLCGMKLQEYLSPVRSSPFRWSPRTRFLRASHASSALITVWPRTSSCRIPRLRLLNSSQFLSMLHSTGTQYTRQTRIWAALRRKPVFSIFTNVMVPPRSCPASGDATASPRRLEDRFWYRCML